MYIYAVPTDVHGGVAVAILLALAALAFAPMFGLWRWQHKRRGARIAEALARDAFRVETRPSEEARCAILDRLGALAVLGSEPERLRWIAQKTIDGRAVTVLRHSHIARGGGTWYDSTRIVVAMATDDPRPGLWLRRINLEADRPDDDDEEGDDRPSLQFGDGWFDRNFRIQGDDPDALTRILTPSVRELIASGPSQESWTIGSGWVVCVFGADTSASGIGVMIRRTQRLIELLGADGR